MALAQPSPLTKIRLKKRISVSDLARQLRIDKGHLSKIERGLCYPSADLALKIVEHFDGQLTRDQVMFPQYHITDGVKKPVRSVPPEVAL